MHQRHGFRLTVSALRLHQQWNLLADEKKKALLKTDDAVKEFGSKVEELLGAGKELETQ